MTFNSSPRIAGLILVGPPAAGKSTIRRLLGDMGVATADVSESPKEEWQDDCWDLLGEAYTDIPVCAIEGLRTNEEVEWFADKLNHTVLVVKVDTHSVSERLDRYMERELDTNQETVSVSDIQALYGEISRTEHADYPDHHVSIYNDDAEPITELATRLRGLAHAISPVPIDDDLLGIE